MASNRKRPKGNNDATCDYKNGGGAKAYSAIESPGLTHTAWWLTKPSLAIRGIEGQIAHGDGLYNGHLPSFRADYHDNLWPSLGSI